MTSLEPVSCVLYHAHSVVHENFGVLHMAQQKWSVAYDEFFSAFRSYSEAGNINARKCLKYVPGVVCCSLCATPQRCCTE